MAAHSIRTTGQFAAWRSKSGELQDDGTWCGDGERNGPLGKYHALWDSGERTICGKIPPAAEHLDIIQLVGLRHVCRVCLRAIMSPYL